MCKVAIIENDDKANDHTLNILWSGYYNKFEYSPMLPTYKDLNKYLEKEIKHISSFLNEETKSQLQIYIN